MAVITVKCLNASVVQEMEGWGWCALHGLGRVECWMELHGIDFGGIQSESVA